MARPKVRPSRPYTISEFLSKAHLHFVIYQNPRCLLDSDDPTGPCAYTGTGCFIGFALTKEDSKKLHNLSVAIMVVGSPTTYTKSADILRHYFDVDDVNVLAILHMGQTLHDLGEQKSFVSHMDQSIEALRRLYRLLREAHSGNVKKATSVSPAIMKL